MRQTSEHQLTTAVIGRDVVAGLTGAAIAIGCLLIPLVHFISGPLGPFIGGWFAGTHVKAGDRDAVIIGLTIGGGMASVVGLVGAAIRALVATSLRLELLFAITAGVLFYGAVLGALGSLLGGRVERRGGGASEPQGRRLNEEGEQT